MIGRRDEVETEIVSSIYVRENLYDVLITHQTESKVGRYCATHTPRKEANLSTLGSCSEANGCETQQWVRR